jgi:hypothetical protein
MRVTSRAHMDTRALSNLHSASVCLSVCLSAGWATHITSCFKTAMVYGYLGCQLLAKHAVASRVWFHSKRLIECWVKQPKNEALRPHPTLATTAAQGEKPAGAAGDVLSTAKFTTVVVGGRKTWGDKEKPGNLSIYLSTYISVLSCNWWWVSTGSSRAAITSIQTISQIFNRGDNTAIFSYSASEPFLLLFYLSLGLQTKWGNHKKVALLPMQSNCDKLTMSHCCCCKRKPTTGRHTQMGYQKKRFTVKLGWLGITTSKSQAVCWFLRQQITSRPHTYMHPYIHTYKL